MTQCLENRSPVIGRQLWAVLSLCCFVRKNSACLTYTAHFHKSLCSKLSVFMCQSINLELEKSTHFIESPDCDSIQQHITHSWWCSHRINPFSWQSGYNQLYKFQKSSAVLPVLFIKYVRRKWLLDTGKILPLVQHWHKNNQLWEILV